MIILISLELLSSSIEIYVLPGLFAEFVGKRFTLLWRGSRDGFGACDFHDRCDSHTPTLTLIQDTMGTIFAGFTPVHWKSFPAPGKWMADPSLKSFIPVSANALAMTFVFPITAMQTSTIALGVFTLKFK
jgi:hypothetical protein